MADLAIRTAEELKALTPLDRQAARRAARGQPLVRQILQTFVERGGPIPAQNIVSASPATGRKAVQEALVALDEDDLIRIRDGQIDIAYPFSAGPTPFRVRLTEGRERYACCAMDALGIAPMIGAWIDISSTCWHCGSPLSLSVSPDGPTPHTEALMVWFGTWGDERCKVADSL